MPRQARLDAPGTLHHVMLRVLADERILGSGDFVEQMLRAGDARAKRQHTRTHRLRAAQALVRQRCAWEHLSAEEVRMGGRRRRLSTMRPQLAVHLVTRLGLSLADAARHFGVSTSGIAKAVARAEAP